MRFFLMIIFFLSALRKETVAQDDRRLTALNYEQKAEVETDSMNSKLNLSAAQKDSVGIVNKDYYFQIVQLQGQNLSLAQRIQQYATLEQSWKDKLAIHLNTTQFTQYFQEIEQTRARWQQKLDSLKTARAGQ